MRRIFLTICLALGAGFVFAADQPQADSGGCMPFGDNWAFMVGAPSGWSVACQAEGTIGVTVALWPSDSSWKKSAVVMYVNPTSKKDPKQSLSGFAAAETDEFRQDNPNLKVTELSAIDTGDNSPSIVRLLTGDRFGNHEAIAYVESKNIFVTFVLSARSDDALKRSLSAFKQLVMSYHYMDKLEGKK